MTYPGIAFVFIISVAIGSAIYYYFNGDGRQDNQHSAHGHRNDYYGSPYVNVPRSSPCKGKKKKKESQYEECIICLQEMTATRTLDCGHKYHTHCIKKWFEGRSTCPLCRHNVSNKM